MHAKVDPTTEIDSAEEERITAQFDEYQHNMRRFLWTRGIDLNQLMAEVSSFGGNVDTVLKIIAGTLGIPLRILVGSERGELASTQDRDNWNDQVASRRRKFGEPLVRALVDRLIQYGALKKPPQYAIAWPEEEELTELQKLEAAGEAAKANQAQAAAGGGLVLTSNEIRDQWLGLAALEEDADDLNGDTDGEDGEGNRAAAAAHPVHVVAERHRPRLERAFAGAFEAARESVDMAALERAIAVGDRGQMEQLLSAAMKDFASRIWLSSRLCRSLGRSFARGSMMPERTTPGIL